MNWLNAIRIGLKGLAVHKVRATLSMLGIIFGVASVVAVVAVSQGARVEMMKQIAALGAKNVIVRGIDWHAADAERREIKKRARLHSEGLTLREAKAAAAACAPIADFAAVRKIYASIRRNEKPVSAEAVGTTPSYLKIMNFNLMAGRWFTQADEENAERVCVLEDAVRRELFSLDKAIGETLIIDHEPYTVIGVLESKQESDEKYEVVDIKQLNNRIYIPLQTALARTTQEPLADEVSEVIFHCHDTSQIYVVQEYLEGFYEAAHNMRNTRREERDYKVLVALDLLKQVEETQRIFNVVMLCSAGISLVVGGIGIMNIMLANVSERRREVGIRRAVGATQADILRQFLMESLSICLLGGLAGCLLGIAFTMQVNRLTGWETALTWWGMAISVGVSLLDGVIFGTYPAWQAARLDPIEALRYE